MSNGLTHQMPHRCFQGKIGLGRSSGQGAKGLLLIGTTGQTKAGIGTILWRNTDKENRIAGLLQAKPVTRLMSSTPPTMPITGVGWIGCIVPSSCLVSL